MEKEQRVTKATQEVAPLAAPQPKKVYERPQILYRAPLEAMAAVCTPAPPGKGLGDGNCTVQFS